MSKIAIIVEGGMVRDVISTNADDEIEVIDFDTQDPDELDEAESRLDEIRKDDSYKSVY